MQLSASMMCAKFDHLSREIQILEEAGIDSFHIDIMDGQFVPNFGMGLQDLSVIRRYTKKPIEVHLMVKNPDQNLKIFIDQKVDVIYIHPEADFQPSVTLQHIIEAGITPGIAICPGTSVESVLELLHIVDRVLIMAVNPGHAGQVYLPYVGQKVDKLLKIKDEYKIELFWDGACTADKIQTYAPKGMGGFVLGTGLLFRHKESYSELIGRARKMGEQKK